MLLLLGVCILGRMYASHYETHVVGAGDNTTTIVDVSFSNVPTTLSRLQKHGRRGFPDLELIVVPFLFACNASVRVDYHVERQTVLHNVSVAPSNGLWKTEHDEMPPYDPVYQVDAYFPTRIATQHVAYDAGEDVGVSIRINPILFNPVRRLMKLVHRVHVHVETVCPNRLSSTSSRRERYVNVVDAKQSSTQRHLCIYTNDASSVTAYANHAILHRDYTTSVFDFDARTFVPRPDCINVVVGQIKERYVRDPLTQFAVPTVNSYNNPLSMFSYVYCETTAECRDMLDHYARQRAGDGNVLLIASDEGHGYGYDDLSDREFSRTFLEPLVDCATTTRYDSDHNGSVVQHLTQTQVQFISYIGHGAPGMLTSGGGLSVHDVTHLTRSTAAMYVVGCKPYKLARELIRNKRVGTIASSRVDMTWLIPMCSNLKFTTYFTEGDAFAEAQLKAMLDTIETYGEDGAREVKFWETQGDPTVRYDACANGGSGNANFKTELEETVTIGAPVESCVNAKWFQKSSHLYRPVATPRVAFDTIGEFALVCPEYVKLTRVVRHKNVTLSCVSR